MREDGVDVKRAILLGMSLVLIATAAFAVPAEHGEHHAPSIGTLLFPLINFTIFSFILWRFAWPAVRATLAERRRRVEGDVDDAERAHRAATAALEEITALRGRRAADTEALLADARREAEVQAGTILEAARRAAERIRTDAQILATQEERRAAQGIRAAVAARVVARATEIVRERFGDAEQRRSVADFLGGISAGGVS